MDVFQWSLPFVAEKVTDMLANVLEYDDDSDEEDVNETQPDGTTIVVKKKKTTKTPHDKETVIEIRGGLLKKKVLAVTKILRMYKTLRQESESIVALKQLTPNHKIPLGLLRDGPDKIKEVLLSFETAKKADQVNEVRPMALSSKRSPELIEAKRVSFISKSKALVSSSPSSKDKDNTPMPMFTVKKWNQNHLQLTIIKHLNKHNTTTHNQATTNQH